MKRRRRRPRATADINLGLAISGALLAPGQFRTLPEIAAYCGTSKQCIQQIEKKALEHLREGLRARGITSLTKQP